MHITALRQAWLLLAFILVGSFANEARAQEATLGAASTRTLICMGERWSVKTIATSQDKEVLIEANARALWGAARTLGRSLTWNEHGQTLTGDSGLTLNLGQATLLGRLLPVSGQVIKGSAYIPVSSLEELLDCKVTIKPGPKGAIYLEPTLRQASITSASSLQATLRLETSAPVRKKVIHLKNPDRTVIDLIGVAPSDHIKNLSHPVLGEIKIAQFQPAPSVTRIVIATPQGVKMTTPKNFDLFVHSAEIQWTPALASTVGPQPQELPNTTTKPVANTPTPIIAPSKTPKAEELPSGAQQTKAPTVMVTDRTELLDAKWVGQELKLSFSRPVRYSWSRLPGTEERFILDFSDVIFPGKRQTLNSSIPNLKSVRIVQNMPEPTPIVRLVCDLDRPIEVVTSSEKDTELSLSFPGNRLASSAPRKGEGRTDQVELANPGTGNGRTICIDPGHGGSDPGAHNRSYGVLEKDVTLDISLRLAKMLRADGWNVVMTRTTDRDVSYAGSPDKEELGARSRTANTQKADLFVSIHCNSSANTSVGGTSIHWYKAEDYTLAKSLRSELITATGRAERGLIKDRFFVLAHTDMPAVLIETAFLSHTEEGKLLASPSYRERIASGLAAGLRSYAASYFPLSTASK